MSLPTLVRDAGSTLCCPVFAFIEAFKEAGNYVDEPECGPPTGQPLK
jgi:hypothetical protein